MKVTLRPATAEDDEFLFALYADTRAEEMAAWGWDAAARQAFLALQFNARHEHYRRAFPDADHRIILLDGERAGRLLVYRSVAEIRLVDIALLASYRDRGAGRALIDDLLREAVATGKPVVLHVEAGNRAMRLYERLGFTKAGDLGSHVRMEWRPAAVAETESAER